MNYCDCFGRRIKSNALKELEGIITSAISSYSVWDWDGLVSNLRQDIAPSCDH